MPAKAPQSSNFRFQSTLPAREATINKTLDELQCHNFNPRFPRGKRHDSISFFVFRYVISIHASREGSDVYNFMMPSLYFLFQSTLPAREATAIGGALQVNRSISIHASREGSDDVLPHPQMSAGNFNPRFPRGKRPLRAWLLKLIHAFQSTLPAREATS